MIFAVANAGYSIIDAYNNPEKTLETEEDTWNLKLPDMEKAGIIPCITRFNQLASRERLDNEPFNVMADINGPFTTTQLCGMEKFSCGRLQNLILPVICYAWLPTIKSK